MRGISDMKSRPRKSQSTIRDRQAIYDEVMEKSMEWLTMDKEQLASEASKIANFTIDPSLKTKEYLLRYIMLLSMKRMIS